MEVVIHGTKDGYRILFSTDSELARLIASDIRNGTNSDNQLGKSAYAIAFAVNGCVFTKYTIIKDTLRSYATGTIAISLFLNSNEKMKGADILKLLDELSDYYAKENIKSNYINRGETTLIREDWTFVNEIKSRFKADPTDDGENIQQGTTDAACIYYSSVEELQKYFDDPFQEEYSQFKQVLFVKNELKGKDENPSNALRNSGLELFNILENKIYYLDNYDAGKRVNIFANGKPRSDGKKNNRIRAKWEVEIKYSRDEICFWPIEAKGTLSNKSSVIYDYLDLKGNNIIIKYDAFNNPSPKREKVSLEVKIKGSDKKITEAKIKCKKAISDYEREVSNNEITFEGEELKENWIVSGKMGYFSGEKDFVPGKTNGKVELVLKESRIVKIKVNDKKNDDIISNFKVHIPKKNFHRITDEIEFVDNEIKEKWDIQIEHNEYISESREIRPAKVEGNEIRFRLAKRELKSTSTSPYQVSAGEYGHLKGGYQYSSNYSDGSDVKNNIVSHPGYEFTHFDLSGDTLIAQYKKKRSLFSRLAVPAGFGVIVLVLGLVAWLLISQHEKGGKNLISSPEISINAEEINKYIEGTQLISDTLERFNIDWQKQMPNKQTDSTSYNKWNVIQQTLEAAILKRKLIDNSDFSGLKKIKFTVYQQKFDSAIRKMDSTHYGKVKEKLGIVSSFSLNQIADSINLILADFKNRRVEQDVDKDEQSDTNKENGAKAQALQKKESLKEPESKEPKQTEKTATQQPEDKKAKGVMPASSANKIKNYLEGSELNQDILKDYRKENGIDEKLKKSIQLCLDFWELDGTKNKTYISLANKVKVDDNLRNSKLNKFLEKMSKEGSPSYSKQDKIKELSKQ